MAKFMSRRERLEAVFSRQEPDRRPILGGWIACPEHICAITGVTLDEYWVDPVCTSIRAYEILGADGIHELYVPLGRSDYRMIDEHNYVPADKGLSLDEVLQRIEAMSSGEEIIERFPLEQAYVEYKAKFVEMQRLCGDIVWVPADWVAGAELMRWYSEFGYEPFFLVIAGYPDHARKMLEIGGANGYNRSRLIARAVQEGLQPHAVLLGNDICASRGCMLSPRFMEEVYAPQLRRGIAPLLEVGCQPIWHCDGDVREIMDLLIDCGIQGFQGFQQELGVTLEYVLQKRTREGQGLMIYGPLAVTSELLTFTPAQVKARLREAIRLCQGSAHLVILTSSTMCPDVPLENIRAMYEVVAEYA